MGTARSADRIALSEERQGRPSAHRRAAHVADVYFLQQWYTPADEALENALYDSQAIREFIGIDLSGEDVPDATTPLKLRRLLEQHGLTAAILA